MTKTKWKRATTKRPVGGPRGRKPLYPWSTMEVGSVFDINIRKDSIPKLVWQANQRYAPLAFRTVPGAFKVQRVA